MVFYTQCVTKGPRGQTERLFALLAVAAIAAIGMASPAKAQTPTLNCGLPDKIESIICADPELMDRDRLMASLLVAASVDVLGVGPSKQQVEQQKWLKNREDTCSREPIRSCAATRYNFRLKDLAIASLFRAPDVALAELRRQNLDVASRDEALYRYATIEDDKERSAVVADLIASSLEKLQRDPWTGGQLNDIPDARVAAASDATFSLVFALAAYGTYDRVPCSALVRRPGLLAILAPRFGSSMDGSLPWSDCTTMLPDLPRLAELVGAAHAAQRFCPGTIRFSI